MGSIPKLSVMRGETHASEPQLLHRLLETAAGVSAPHAAVLCEGRVTSYGALDAAANRLARVLLRHVRSAGARANADGDHLVAVCMAPSERLVTALLAVWKAGAAYLPLDPSFPEPRVRHILKESAPVLLIADTVDPDAYVDYEGAVSFEALQAEARDVSSETLPDSETLPQTGSPLAIVMYTSGSTGIPKGVRLPHCVVLNRLRWQWRVLPYGPQERACVFKTALTFVDSVCELWGPLLKSRTVVVVPKDVTCDPSRLVQTLEHHKVERLVLVPSLLRALLMHLGTSQSRRPLSHLRLWVCSGETLAPDLVHGFFQRFPPGEHVLHNFYGSTEVMGDVTYHEMASLQDVTHEKVPIGRPLDNTAIYLLDQNFRPVVAGEVGELFVSGLNLAQGYVSGRDSERFIPNPLTVDPDFCRLYRTGDYARLVKGTIVYEGRTDSQVKIRGHRVDLSEVEGAVTATSGVEKGVVLCYKPGEINQALLAFVKTAPDTSLTAQELEAALQSRLAPYMLPQVIMLDSIPLLVNGKTDRQGLLKSYEETYKNGSDEGVKVDLDYTGIPPKKMDAATTLFETVASVLGSSARSKLCRESNFYELGGNSLNSVYTVTRLRDQGYIIGITDFISAKDLSQVLDRMYPEGENDAAILSVGKQAQTTKYVSQMLNDSHKEKVTSMITSSFYEKADLEQWLMPHIHREDYTDLVDKIWEPLVEKNLSFVVNTVEGETVGVGLNFDAHDEPEVEITSKLLVIFEFLEHLEGPIRDERLPHGKGQILHSFMMATNKSLNYQQNVEVIQFMEEEVMRLARNKCFAGIFTTNTSPLTQQLGTDIYDYQVLLNYQVNTYVSSDGSKPFEEAPDWQKAVCSWRPV